MQGASRALSIGGDMTMLYQKNLPTWERALRVAAAVAMIAYGLVGLQGLALGWLVAASGVFVGLTGFVGFCPACAMVGRKLDRRVRDRAAGPR
jgi:hypothetical protein